MSSLRWHLPFYLPLPRSLKLLACYCIATWLLRALLLDSASPISVLPTQAKVRHNFSSEVKEYKWMIAIISHIPFTVFQVCYHPHQLMHVCRRSSGMNCAGHFEKYTLHHLTEPCSSTRAGTGDLLPRIDWSHRLCKVNRSRLANGETRSMFPAIYF